VNAVKGDGWFDLGCIVSMLPENAAVIEHWAFPRTEAPRTTCADVCFSYDVQSRFRILEFRFLLHVFAHQLRFAGTSNLQYFCFKNRLLLDTIFYISKLHNLHSFSAESHFVKIYVGRFVAVNKKFHNTFDTLSKAHSSINVNIEKLMLQSKISSSTSRKLLEKLVGLGPWRSW